MAARRGDVLALTALLLSPFLVYARLFLPGTARRFFPDGDFVDQFYAFARFEVASFARGELPVWNPFAYSGGPFWADLQAAVAYPPSLVNALLHAWLRDGHLPFSALQAEAVAHIGLGAVFTYLFARRTIGGPFPALVAAVTFGYGGYLTGYPLLQLAVIETVVWLPLVLLGLHGLAAASAGRARSWARCAGWAALTGGATACAILAGHGQTALHLLYAAGIFAAWRTWRLRGDLKARVMGAWCAVAATLAAAASAAGWLPALEFLRLSNRIQSDYTFVAHGFPPRELAGLVVPGLTHWSPLHVGALSLLLAIAAAGHVLSRQPTGQSSEPRTARDREREPGPAAHQAGTLLGRPVRAPERAGWPPDRAEPDPAAMARFFLLLGSAALVVSLGSNAIGFDLLYVAAPGWDLFRGQERAAALVSFSLAMAAGSGAALWRAGDPAPRRLVVRAAAGLAAVYALVLVLAPPGTARLEAALLATLVAAVLAARYPVAPRAAVLAVIAVELFWTHAGTNLVATPPTQLAVRPVVSALAADGPQRVANDHRLAPNFGLLHEVEATSGASPLWLARWAAMNEAAGHAGEARVWDLAAVSHVVTWPRDLPVPAHHIVTQGAGDDAALLFALDAPAPPVWRTGAAEVVDDGEATRRLADPSFDIWSTALLATGSGGRHGASGGLAEVERVPGRVVVQTTGEGPGWLVFAENHYPGWQATVDGRPAPVLRSHLALIAVPVDAGRHIVTLTFRPTIVRGAIAVSVAGWLLVAGLAALAVRHATRAASTPATSSKRSRSSTQ